LPTPPPLLYNQKFQPNLTEPLKKFPSPQKMSKKIKTQNAIQLSKSSHKTFKTFALKILYHSFQKSQALFLSFVIAKGFCHPLIAKLKCLPPVKTGAPLWYTHRLNP